MIGRIAGGIIWAVVMLAGALSASAQTAVGVNAVVQNDVSTRGAAESAWRPSVVDGRVHFADEITTGAQSSVLVQLRDQSELSIGANARLVVDRLVFDPSQNDAGVAFAIMRGAFRFVSGSRGADRERVGFRTPTATIGIRGTVIEGVVGPEALEVLNAEAGLPDLSQDPETATIIVLVEGEIEFEVDGERMIVREPGQAVAISGRRMSRPFALSPEAGRRMGTRVPPRLGGPAGPAGVQGQPDGPGATRPPGPTPAAPSPQAVAPPSPPSTAAPAQPNPSTRPNDRGAPAQRPSGGRRPG